MSNSPRRSSDLDDFSGFEGVDTRVLSTVEERKLLRELAECKKKLQNALARMPKATGPDGTSAPMDISQYVAITCAGHGPVVGAGLGAVVRKYTELRTRLAMANSRLVAHVAKQFRDRGIAYSDLMQEGFCGLLEAIDRFDVAHETKLATYATWWIRQSMQRAVAAGAYPVRLSPRHLRQLAQNQNEIELQEGAAAPKSDLIRSIHTATRPTLSLDATLDRDGQYSLLQTMRDPEPDQADAVDTDETINKLLAVLRPREQEVIALRFGLGGQPRLSLSQVGHALSVSKERVRQIQDRALVKLRSVAEELGIEEELVPV